MATYGDALELTTAVRTLRQLKEDHPRLGVLVLSQHLETSHVVDLVQQGGFGCLLQDRVLDVADFLAAAERVARGGSALDPEVVARLIGGRGSDDPLASPSERETTVLELMVQGLTNAGIAPASVPQRADRARRTSATC